MGILMASKDYGTHFVTKYVPPLVCMQCHLASADLSMYHSQPRMTNKTHGYKETGTFPTYIKLDDQFTLAREFKHLSTE